MKILPIVLAVLAIATGLLAWLPRSQSDAAALGIQDRFFGPQIDEDDPTEVLALSDTVDRLTVAEWHDGGPRQVRIEQRDGSWVIASHHGYPADATGSDELGQVGKAIGSVLGVPKLRRVSDDPDRHRELGVVDPRNLDVVGDRGRGTFVSIADENGATLVELVVGDAVPGEAGRRYVRAADSHTVFVATIDVTPLSTRFIDWVEPNPIDLARDAIRALTVQNYSIEDQTPMLRFNAVLEREDPQSDWTSEQTPEELIVDQDGASKIARRVANLRLADVFPRYDSESLPAPMVRRYLAQMGFYVDPEGRLIGDEGVLKVTADTGFTYSFYFGFVADTATGAPDAEGAEESTDSELVAVADEQDRIVAIEVSYHPDDDRRLPALPEKPAADGDQTEGDEPEGEGDAAETAAYAERLAKAKDQRAKHRGRRIEELERLNERFGAYFYVVRDSDFQALRPSVDTLFTEPPEDDDQDGEAATGEE